MSAGTRGDAELAKELEELRRKFVADGSAPGNVIAAWQAIAQIARRNKECTARGETPCPAPSWVNEYLLHSADKIERLCVGIAPDDDRPVTEVIAAGEFGCLRQVRRADGKLGERIRDERASHVSAALGFAGKGWSAFARHDRAEADDRFLRMIDNPELTDKSLRNEVRRRIGKVVERQEGLSGQAIRNRLSKARAKTRGRNPKA